MPTVILLVFWCLADHVKCVQAKAETAAPVVPEITTEKLENIPSESTVCGSNMISEDFLSMRGSGSGFGRNCGLSYEHACCTQTPRGSTDVGKTGTVEYETPSGKWEVGSAQRRMIRPGRRTREESETKTGQVEWSYEGALLATHSALSCVQSVTLTIAGDSVNMAGAGYDVWESPERTIHGV
jgi:hypothetical protein